MKELNIVKKKYGVESPNKVIPTRDEGIQCDLEDLDPPKIMIVEDENEEK